MCLTILLPQACATTDDLLEFCHGTDHLIQNDQLGHLAICSRGEQFGSCGDDRILRSNGNEIVQLALAIVITAGDPDYIVRILLNHIRVAVDKRLAHPLGSILCSAEHDGFRHAVSRLKILGDLSSNLVDSIFNYDVVIKITVCVNAILDRIAVLVKLSALRTPPISNVCGDVYDLEWGQEAILNTRFKAVCVDGVSKVADVGDILGLLGCCGHADLGGGGEVLQDSAPPALFFC